MPIFLSDGAKLKLDLAGGLAAQKRERAPEGHLAIELYSLSGNDLLRHFDSKDILCPVQATGRLGLQHEGTADRI